MAQTILADKLNKRIAIQKFSVVSDSIGNRVPQWEDCYTCWAYANNLSGREYWAAAQNNAQHSLYFLIRYSSKVADLNPEQYRVKFRGQIYNLTFIDNVQYENKTLKLMAELAPR
ncbi:MAG: phage head closure protein [Butyricicoccaceae bacterium]